jgi:hypothetical protein
MNVPYVIPRVIRHFLPARITRFLLIRSLIIRPGLETAEPQAAVERYVQVLEARGQNLTGRRVLVFGYGGRYDIGLHLLEAGAAHVVLCDKYARPDDMHNGLLEPRYAKYLRTEAGHTLPRAQWMTLVEQDVRELQASGALPLSDLVVSTSVYEHLEDVEGTTSSLAALTAARGLNIHFVDLRDHFFKYPFEMLHYSERTWRHWLNPTSNHNRYRLWDYRRVFDGYFGQVDIGILERDEAGFAGALGRIRPEFRRGNLLDDSVTLIRIVAAQPGRQVPW